MVLYLLLLDLYIFCLSACNRACLKVTIAMFYFCHSKNSSNIMKNIFDSISIYYCNKMLTNIRNKCFMRKINLQFLKLSKIPKCFLQMFVIFNMITDSSLVQKCGTLERARRYVCKNLLNLDYQNSIHFGIVKLLINEESLRKSFIFQQNVLKETWKVCFKKF